MIVRDEARHLPACFASLKGIADEMVVVDTGSVDDSAAIARDHGAKVLHHPWNDDFSAPRNVGLEHATGRWILCIDADERLRPTDRSRVHALLEKAPEIAFQVRLHPAGGYTPSYAVLIETDGKERQQRWILFAGLTGAMRTVADERSVDEILSGTATSSAHVAAGDDAR